MRDYYGMNKKEFLFVQLALNLERETSLGEAEFGYMKAEECSGREKSFILERERSGFKS